MQDINKTKVKSWMYLSKFFGIASPYLEKLLRIYDDADLLLEKIVNKEIPDLHAKALSKADEQNINDILNYCVNKGIYLLTPDDEMYPYRLKSIDGFPAVLYCMGNVSCLDSKAVAVVGARKASNYSLKVAEYFAQGLAENSYTVISGFANGIDSSAHSGAVKAGGFTVAVLGCGVEYDYPKGKSDLKKLISENGAVISEYPPLESPKPQYFKVRNRIISGLSDGVLVVQASAKSGSLNTSSHALAQGREVFAVAPHDIFDKNYEGQINLINDGAVAVCSPMDIVENLS